MLSTSNRGDDWPSENCCHVYFNSKKTQFLNQAYTMNSIFFSAVKILIVHVFKVLLKTLVVGTR